jgi:hypothetical protein
MALRGTDHGWQVAECLLPGVTESSAEELAGRVRAELAGSAGTRVSFLGSLLLPEDEVLLCLFTGAPAEVRLISERAAVPFERILACIAVGWRDSGAGDSTG